MLHSNENFGLTFCFLLPYLCEISLPIKYYPAQEMSVVETYHSVEYTLQHYSFVDMKEKADASQLVRVHFSTKTLCHCWGLSFISERFKEYK